MVKCSHDFKIPSELMGEDVYDMLYLFDDENEAVEYVTKNYNTCKEDIICELHEEDSMREEFGKENYLRSASVSDCVCISELMSGKYILWEAY